MLALHLLLFGFFSQGLEVYQNRTHEAIEVSGVSVSFPENYVSGREAFRSKAQELKKIFPGSELGFYKVPAKTDNTLTTDYFFIPGEKSKKLFILTSGIHGAEGPAGHALQMAFFEKLKKSKKRPPVNILVVHAVNPFGFKYFRRANENNVDLNRNFAQPADFQSENREYEKMKSLVQPTYVASGDSLSRIGFYAKTIWVNIWRGRKFISGALRGQYKNPQGIFYGGSELQPETLATQKLIKSYAARAVDIYHVDLHTGFGENKRLHFFGSDKNAADETLKKVFGDLKIDTGHDKNFYSVTGDFSYWLFTAFPKKRVIPMTFEFGTRDSQTLHGALRSLWAVVLDNQGQHQGYLSPEHEKIARIHFEKLFNPQSAQWQKAVLQSGTDALEKTLVNFAAL